LVVALLATAVVSLTGAVAFALDDEDESMEVQPASAVTRRKKGSLCMMRGVGVGACGEERDAGFERSSLIR
jgi:hypothetical protein